MRDITAAAFCSVVTINATEGALNGKFSVSADKQVVFSKGNLQATTADLGANWAWGFAEHQYDVIGAATANNTISGDKTVSSNGTIDLFGWSTATTYYGINNSTTSSDYSGDFVDWGATIGEGWYTLSKDEWVYLFLGRTDAAHLFGMGSVNGVNGTILLPDNWEGDKFTDTDSKWIASWLAQISFHLQGVERQIIFGLTDASKRRNYERRTARR